MRRFPGNAAADRQERDAERPRGQVVSERLAAQSGDVARTWARAQTHTPGNRRAPLRCQRVTRWPICSALPPSGTPSERCPQIAGPVLHKFPGRRADRRAHLLAEDQTHASSLASLLRRPKKKKAPVNPTDQELSRRRFKDGDALRR